MVSLWIFSLDVFSPEESWTLPLLPVLIEVNAPVFQEEVFDTSLLYVMERAILRSFCWVRWLCCGFLSISVRAIRGLLDALRRNYHVVPPEIP